MRSRWYATALVAALAACSSGAEQVELVPAPGLMVPVEVTTTTVPPTTTSTTTSTTLATSTTRAPATTTAPAVPAAGTTTASWYGDESGAHTANGDSYDPSGLTFAHRKLRFGTAVRFCGPLGCVVATCTDRGPATWTGRDFDLSEGSFGRVARLSEGVARLSWEVVE